MKINIWLVAGIAGMLLGMPCINANAEYRGDRFEERGPRYGYEDRRFERRHYRDRFERRRWEREERRRWWREEERRRLRRIERHRYEHRHDGYRRY
jgi:hypothetical protein